MMGNYFGDIGWGFGFGFGWIFMLLFWVLVIWAIFALVRGFSGHNCCGHNHGEHHQEGNKALDIIKERYAKGEISKEDFERMKKELSV